MASYREERIIVERNNQFWVYLDVREVGSTNYTSTHERTFLTRPEAEKYIDIRSPQVREYFEDESIDLFREENERNYWCRVHEESVMG